MTAFAHVTTLRQSVAARMMWRLMRDTGRFYLATVVLMTVVSAFEWRLFPALIERGALDSIARSAPGLVIAGFIAAEALCRLVTTGIYFGMVHVEATYRFQMVTRLVENLFQHIFRQPGAAALPISTGEAVSRFRDDTEEIHSYAHRWTDLPARTLWALVGLGALLRINLLVTLLIVLPIGVLAAVYATMRRRFVTYREVARTATERVTGALGEAFGAVQAIQVSGAEIAVSRHIHALGAGRRRAAVNDRFFTEIMEAVYQNTNHLAAAGTMLLIAPLFASGEFGLGDVALYLYFPWWLVEFASRAFTMHARHAHATVSFDRLHQLMGPGVPPEALVAPRVEVVTERSGAARGLGGARPAGRSEARRVPVEIQGSGVSTGGRIAAGRASAPLAEPLQTLEVRGLSYSHPTSTTGIRRVSFTLHTGTLTVITGRIGSGKTTLLRVLLGLLPRDSGEILWNGQPVHDPASFLTPPRAAYTPQVPRLFSETLRDNILLGVEAGDDSLRAALHLAVLNHDLAQLEHGLETQVGPRGVRLSGGQIQRAAAARMLVRRPELLVFDDMSSAVDVETESLLWQRLFAFSPGVTILAVSHRPAVLDRADQILTLEAGRPV